MKKQVNPSIASETYDFFTGNFDKNVRAMADVLETFALWATTNPAKELFGDPMECFRHTLDSSKAMYREARRTVKGVFGRDELGVMLSVMNGTALTHGMPGETLRGNLEDVLPHEHNFDLPPEKQAETIKKFSDLGVFERSYLEVWAWSYWYGHTNQDMITPDEYMSRLL